MAHLSASQLNKLRKQLEQEKANLEQRLEHSDNYGLGQSLRDQTGELSAYDNHPGDLGTEMYERGKDIALNERTSFILEDVKTALQRMDEGTYGQCEICGKEIPAERLAAMPMALTCIEHVRDRDITERPVEEKFLAPPFGRTSFDEKENETEFDGEDAWQTVANWGTSDSPAYSEGNHVDGYEEVFLESDEAVGYVEPIENFVATDLYGKQVMVVRNESYRRYMEDGEGEALLEPDAAYEEDRT